MSATEQQQADLAAAFVSIGDAFVEAFRPMAERMAQALTRMWEALGPLARAVLADETQDPALRTAVRALSDGLDDAEQTYEVALDGLRKDLVGLDATLALRGRLWAALTPGLTERDVLDRAGFLLWRFDRERGPRLAVAVLEGWAERCAR